MANKTLIGPYSAYAIAVKHGYQGTEDEWAKTLIDAGNNAASAAESKTAAAQSAENAATSETNVAQAEERINTAVSGAVEAVVAQETKSVQAVAAQGEASAAAVTAEGERVLGTIPEDYTELSNGVSQLKDDIEYISAPGKNIFDKGNPNIVKGYIHPEDAIIKSNDNATIIYTECESNKEYTISKEQGARFAVACCEEIPKIGTSLASVKANNSGTALTIKTTATAKYIVAWVWFSTDTISESAMLNTVQIELGVTATEYEPYNMSANDKEARTRLHVIENSEQMKGIFESVTANAGIKANSSVRAAKYEAEIPVDIASMSSTGNVIYEDEKWHFDLGGKITGNVDVVGGKLYLVYPDITFESGIDGDINTNPCTITLGDDHVAIFSANDANWYVVLTPSATGKTEISFEANDNWRGYISGFHIIPIKSNAGIPFISNDISMMSHINNLSLGGHRNILYGSEYGRQNTSFGYNAQKNINTGVWNSAVGFNAQSMLTSGKGNNAFGFATQAVLTTGCYNNAFGESAQNHMVDGQWNDGFGIETQSMCTNGKNNVAFGRRSQHLLETGCFNTAVGAWSGFNYHGQKEGKYAVKTANYTTLIGASAVLASEEQSNYATALGFQAMSGAKCIALGADAKAKGNESVAIGYGVEATKDKEIVIGTSNHSIIISGKKIIFNADHTVTWEDV